MKIFSKTTKIIFSILIFLIILRATAPIIGLKVINWALANKIGNYHGKIDDFDFTLYRGAYQLQDLVIREKGSSQPPILKIKNLDLQVAWQPLLRKEISANVDLDEVILQFFDSRTKKKQQLGETSSWKKTLSILIPTSINSLKIKNSAVYFTNNDLKKPLPVKIENIQFEANNLRSRPDSDKDSLTPVTAQALLQGHAYLKLNGEVDGLAKSPRLDLNLELDEFQLKTLNPLLMEYIPLDITKGTIRAYGEMASSDKKTKGYVNLFLQDGDVIAPKQEFKSFKHFGYEIIGGLGNWFLKNSKSKKLSSHITFQGRGQKFSIDKLGAIWSTIDSRKKPLKEGLENSINLTTVENESRIE